MRLRTITAAAFSAALLAVGAPAALAQSPSEEGYSTPGGVVQTQLQSGGDNGGNPATRTAAEPAAVRPAANSDSKLPFTGLDIALVVGAGGMLLLLGFGMRRLSRPAGLA